MSFINPTILARQVKEAHKAEKLKFGILERADGDEGLAIFCKNTVYWIEWWHVPNKVKASLIEFVGFEPKSVGVIYGHNQEGEYAPGDRDLVKVLQARIIEMDEANEPYKESGLLAVDRFSMVRLVQNVKDLEILGIRQDYLDVIDLKFLDEENESPPVGPNYLPGEAAMVYTNATTIFGCAAYSIGASRKFKTIIDTLTLVDMTESD